MENKNAGYIWHPVWHIIPGLKKYKTKFKKLKTEEKKTCKIPVSIEMYLKQWKIIFLQVYRR